MCEAPTRRAVVEVGRQFALVKPVQGGEGGRTKSLSTRTSAERKVREWSDRLNDAAEHPERLGSAYLVGGSPGEVHEGSRGESELHGG